VGPGVVTPPATRAPRAYANPYLSGVGLGLVLLAAFLVTGHGLGASGAAAAVVSAGVEAVSPAHARANPFFGAWTGADGSRAPLADWIVLEVLGLMAGAALSAWAAGRWEPRVERGPGISDRRRVVAAFGGGAVMAFGARLARGCTSGLGLTGGAALSVGAWVFLLTLFAAGYAVAPLLRRSWR
jgi:uncharacterized membrane protein YedE/YeeE